MGSAHLAPTLPALCRRGPLFPWVMSEGFPSLLRCYHPLSRLALAVGEGSLVAFVVSLNLHRRHLNESQRAMVAAKIANLEHGGDRKSNQAANLPLDSVTVTEASGLLNVSERSTKSAKKVLDEGSALLVEKVEQGAVAVSTAADIVISEAAQYKP